MKKLPKISILLITNNSARTLDKCFELLFSQTYPNERIEIIIPDSGSTDGTLEIIEKYRNKYKNSITLFHNPRKYKLGRGMGADLASRRATGDMILMIDPDNLLIQKDWLENMVKILIENEDIAAVQSATIIPESGSVIDKYFGAIGIEDPFAIPYSLNAQVIFNTKNFAYNPKGFHIYEVNKKDFYYFGDNGFLIWKDIFFENQGYTQDIDNAYRMAISGKKYKIAVTKDIKIYHNSSNTLSSFLKKKGFYVRIYISNNKETRSFNWFNLRRNTIKQNTKFIKSVLFNLMFLPALFTSLKFFFKERKEFWFVHPIMLFLITLNYIFSFIFVKASGRKFSL